MGHQEDGHVAIVTNVTAAFHSERTEPKPEIASVYLTITDRREFREIQTQVG